jgi:hypothetical protein
MNEVKSFCVASLKKAHDDKHNYKSTEHQSAAGLDRGRGYLFTGKTSHRSARSGQVAGRVSSHDSPRGGAWKFPQACEDWQMPSFLLWRSAGVFERLERKESMKKQTIKRSRRGRPLLFCSSRAFVPLHAAASEMIPSAATIARSNL